MMRHLARVWYTWYENASVEAWTYLGRLRTRRYSNLFFIVPQSITDVRYCIRSNICDGSISSVATHTYLGLSITSFEGYQM